jgi:hypothetical protein
MQIAYSLNNMSFQFGQVTAESEARDNRTSLDNLERAFPDIEPWKIMIVYMSFAGDSAIEIRNLLPMLSEKNARGMLIKHGSEVVTEISQIPGAVTGT